MQSEKERNKALGDMLVLECKSPHYSLDIIESVLQNGADIDYNNSRPLYWAAKQHKFELVKFLLNRGASAKDIALTYISTMCDFKGFTEAMEPQFFEILDVAHSKTGGYMTLFTPYINSMAVAGRTDKLRALMSRYYLTEREVAEAVYIRIIFEIIMKNCDEMLEFIEKHKSWMSQSSFDLCVSTGEWIVLEHFITNSDFRTPSVAAVGQAVYEGYFEVLDILDKTGYSFAHKPLLLEKACRAAYSKGTKSLEYLLKRGYSLRDRYNGKTISEHALEDNNAPLCEFLQGKAG
jgi:hypothetical protein